MLDLCFAFTSPLLFLGHAKFSKRVKIFDELIQMKLCRQNSLTTPPYPPPPKKRIFKFLNFAERGSRGKDGFLEKRV